MVSISSSISSFGMLGINGSRLTVVWHPSEYKVSNAEILSLVEEERGSIVYLNDSCFSGMVIVKPTRQFPLYLLKKSTSRNTLAFFVRARMG